MADELTPEPFRPPIEEAPAVDSPVEPPSAAPAEPEQPVEPPPDLVPELEVVDATPPAPVEDAPVAAEPVVELPEDDPVEDLVIVAEQPPERDPVRVLDIPRLVTLLGPAPTAPVRPGPVETPINRIQNRGALASAADALRAHLARNEALTIAAQAFEQLATLDQQISDREAVLRDLNARIVEAQDRVDAQHSAVLRARVEAETMTRAVNEEVAAIRRVANELADQHVEAAKQQAREHLGDAMAEANALLERARAEAQDAHAQASAALANAAAANQAVEAARAQQAIVESQTSAARAKLREMLGE